MDCNQPGFSVLGIFQTISSESKIVSVSEPLPFCLGFLRNTNEATDKQLISKIYKQLLQLHSRKINDPIKNGPKN